MVYFENTFRWSFFDHDLKMHGPTCMILVCLQCGRTVSTCSFWRRKSALRNIEIDVLTVEFVSMSAHRALHRDILTAVCVLTSVARNKTADQFA
jgi:hypothetical protein